jgi:hypothetical protein
LFSSWNLIEVLADLPALSCSARGKAIFAKMLLAKRPNRAAYIYRNDVLHGARG